MKRTSLLTLLPAAGLLLAACAATPEDTAEAEAWQSDARLGEKVDRICFTANVDNFREPTRQTVIVERGVNDEYLVETVGSCFDLDRAGSLAFDTLPGSGCITRGDNIIAFDSAFGPDRTGVPPQRCPIKAIYEWDEDALAEEDATDGEE